ncbi:ataxin-3-like [Planococcus citri]|uniref:ataxin-3-like n=1 Tax=Planococcus citri TaxID=170843 RepID=UPI0031FA0CED
MEYIFHEKQEGRLCAQHCLNSLLQGPYFSPIELGDLAQSIDSQERDRMAECGTESDSYKEFVKQPSENVDDSGYFSLEVINAALVPWNLELIPFNSSEERAQLAREDPASMSAYICNYHHHWYTIRKIGHQWFNLDSTIKKPRLLSETYLAVYLAQIRTEGYSIFIVFGELPPCEADEILKLTPVTEPSADQSRQSSIPCIDIDNDEDDENLQLALQMSLQDPPLVTNTPQQALPVVDLDEVRKKRMQRFG